MTSRTAAILALAALSGCAAIPKQAIAELSPDQVLTRPICADGQLIGLVVATRSRGFAQITWTDDPCAGGI